MNLETPLQKLKHIAKNTFYSILIAANTAYAGLPLNTKIDVSKETRKNLPVMQGFEPYHRIDVEQNLPADVQEEYDLARQIEDPITRELEIFKILTPLSMELNKYAHQSEYLKYRLLRGDNFSIEDSNEEYAENTERVKLTALSLIGQEAEENYEFERDDIFNMDYERTETEIQEAIRDETGKAGICADIHYFISKCAERLGFKGVGESHVSQTGGDHLISFLRTERDGIAFVDYGNVYLTKTNNLEDALSLYQQRQGVVSFFHGIATDRYLFTIVTPEGKAFREFTGMYPDLEDLVEDERKNEGIELDVSNSRSSIQLQRGNFTIKAGRLNTDLKDPMKSAYIEMARYNFPFIQEIGIGHLRIHETSGIKNSIFLTSKFRKGIHIKNFSGYLGVNTSIDQGILSDDQNVRQSVILPEANLDAGLNGDLRLLNIYLLNRLSLSLNSPTLQVTKLINKETALGIRVGNKNTLTQEVGVDDKEYYLNTNLTLNNDLFSLMLEGKLTKSKYPYFNPHKKIINILLSKNVFGTNVGVGLDYKLIQGPDLNENTFNPKIHIETQF